MTDFSELQASAERLQGLSERGDLVQARAEVDRLQQQIAATNEQLQAGREGQDEAGQVTASVNALGHLLELEVSPKLIQQGGDALSTAIVDAVKAAHSQASESFSANADFAPPTNAGAQDFAQQFRSVLDEHVPRDMTFLRDMFESALAQGQAAVQQTYPGAGLDGAITVQVDVAGQLLEVVTDRVATRDLDNITFAEGVVAAVAAAQQAKDRALQPRLPSELEQLLDPQTMAEVGLPDPRDLWPRP